ncbi:MAG: OsmC family protein [Ferruginibacter sp.]
MPGKKSKKFLFNVQLNWQEKKRGILYANDVKDSIHVATPKVFNGEGEEWSPEHLLLGAVSSCYMSTLLFNAARSETDFTHFECEVIGQIEAENGKLRFVMIDVYPKIFIADESERERAVEALEQTSNSCLISNSINANILYHPKVTIEKKADSALKTNHTGQQDYY